ncbi:MAG: choice-of-anchor D domain-containing protein [Spirochaetia bacterium]
MKYFNPPFLWTKSLIILCAAARMLAGCTTPDGGGDKDPTVSITWQGAAVPDGAIHYNLGTVPPNQDTEYTFTISNNSGQELSLSGNPDKIEFNGDAGFTKDETATADLLAPSAATTFKLTLDSADAHSRDVYTADISILNSSADRNPYTFSVKVTVAAPDVRVTLEDGSEVPWTADYGTHPAGATVPKTFVITNTGNADLEVAVVLGDPIQHPGFTLDDSGITSPVPPGGSTSFIVTFHADDAGTYENKASIVWNDPDGSNNAVSVQGTIEEPEP